MNKRSIATTAFELNELLRGYPPIRPETLGHLVTFLRQSQKALADPTAPKPDITLLTHEPHGPFRTIRVADAGGESAIEFTVRNPDRKPRFVKPPEAFLVLRLQLAFGGGCSVNDTGTGLGYIKLYSDREGLIFDRLVGDAGLGEMVLHRNETGEQTDYHNIDAAFRTKVVALRVVDCVRQRTPRRGRGDAINTALRYFRRNRQRSGTTLTEREYELLLTEAYALLDAR